MRYDSSVARSRFNFFGLIPDSPPPPHTHTQVFGPSEINLHTHTQEITCLYQPFILNPIVADSVVRTQIYWRTHELAGLEL